MLEMNKSKGLPIRPYARLLTMLGDQLIKNECVALVELIKNAYDADSPWVKVCIDGVDNGNVKDQTITIEDAGCGMTENVILEHWLNPATPEKRIRKNNNRGVTESGRILQGDKGIGRFAILKLARRIEIVTRAKGEDAEYVIGYDFSKYDDEFLTENHKAKSLFLDALRVDVTKRTPCVFINRKVDLGIASVKAPQWGTRIVLHDLKSKWTKSLVEDVGTDVAYLQPIFDIPKARKNYTDPKEGFSVSFYVDGEREAIQETYIGDLRTLLDNSSVLRITDGRFNASTLSFTFRQDGRLLPPIKISDSIFKGLYLWKRRFKASDGLNWRPTCGSFNFQFYIFDFSAAAADKYALDKRQKDIIKRHRIYLYRDKIRVYPYGDPTDDWLSVDTLRGTISAGMFLSNNQVVGCVDITQKENPSLKDKTNREGLIEEGEATKDFIFLLQLFLSFVRHEAYRKYLEDSKVKKAVSIVANGEVEKRLDAVKEALEAGNIGEAKSAISQASTFYKAESDYMQRRVRITEDLAGVGLSVETASHDIMGMMSKVLLNLDGLIRDLVAGDEINRDNLLKELQSLSGGMSFIDRQLRDIQLLFTSSKQRRRPLDVRNLIDKVAAIYGRLLKKYKIQFTVDEPRGSSPLMAKTTDAVVLQLLINLFDNAVYWLNVIDRKNKEIRIYLDGNSGKMIFSDNGPGVREEDKPYIFEAFYSGKGEDGRGLGLYIARKLLERHDYGIELADTSSEKRLSGANFVVSFVAGGGKEHE